MGTRIDMIGIFVADLGPMVAFYRDVLGFEITWDGSGPYAEFVNEGVRFSMYERAQLPGLLGQTPGYPAGLNGTFELAIDLPTSADADQMYAQVIAAGGQPVYAPRRRAVGHALVDDRRPGGQSDRDRVVESRDRRIKEQPAARFPQMEKKGIFTKALAIAGTVLVWIPDSGAGLVLCGFSHPGAHVPVRLPHACRAFPGCPGRGVFAPLGRAAGAGAARAHRGEPRQRSGPAGGRSGACLVTGLASGRTEPTGWPWALVLASLALYVLALVVLGIGGVLLLRDLFKAARPPIPGDTPD